MGFIRRKHTWDSVPQRTVRYASGETLYLQVAPGQDYSGDQTGVSLGATTVPEPGPTSLTSLIPFWINRRLTED